MDRATGCRGRGVRNIVRVFSRRTSTLTFGTAKTGRVEGQVEVADEVETAVVMTLEATTMLFLHKENVIRRMS